MKRSKSMSTCTYSIRVCKQLCVCLCLYAWFCVWLSHVLVSGRGRLSTQIWANGCVYVHAATPCKETEETQSKWLFSSLVSQCTLTHRTSNWFICGSLQEDSQPWIISLPTTLKAHPTPEPPHVPFSLPSLNANVSIVLAKYNTAAKSAVTCRHLSDSK